MKKLYIFLLLLCLSGVAYGQFTVNGMVLRTNGDSVQGALVHIYPDTSSGPLTFTPVVDTTNSSGFYSVILPAIPNGSKFIVATLNCDNVTYVTNQHTATGNNISSNLVICVTPPSTQFSGYVYLGDVTKRPPQQQAQVYLISKCPGNALTYIDSVETDTNGFYSVGSFPTLSAGCELIMKAALKPMANDYTKYLPAYHETNTTYSLRWSGGKEVSQQVSQNGVNILLPQAINPFGGPSVIAGYAMDSTTQSRLHGKVLFITDMNDVTISHAFTNSNGEFSFGNLPFGTYKIFGDVWGKDNPDLVVTVDADHVNVYNVVFRESDTEFRGSIAVSVAGAKTLQDMIALYPVPAYDMVYVQGARGIPGDKSVVIRTITGKVVFTGAYSSGKDMGIPVHTLVPGVYLLNISTQQASVNFRLIKN